MVATDGKFDARRVDFRIRLAMRILEFEQTKVPGLKGLADRVGLSPFHFSRLFAAQVGESSAAYGRRIRLDCANNQLIHDPVPIGVAAVTFGYDSQAAFTRAYTRQFGLPPRDFIASFLGRTQAQFAATHLGPVGRRDPGLPLLSGPIRLVTGAPRPALVRRFVGYDLADHWRRFMADLPAGLADGAQLAGLSYDNAAVTPDRHWRYDCAVVFEAGRRYLPIPEHSYGLDLVEVPGGLHAATTFDGEFASLWRATVGLYTEWLPGNPGLQPEGDPNVHWLELPTSTTPLRATATIRVRARGSPPAFNIQPLSRYGRPAGRRTDPASALSTNDIVKEQER